MLEQIRPDAPAHGARGACLGGSRAAPGGGARVAGAESMEADHRRVVGTGSGRAEEAAAHPTRTILDASRTSEVQDWPVNVRPLVPVDAEACDAVLATLPYFFGDPDGIAECARAVRTQGGWVAEDADEIVAFVTVEAIFLETVEITWLAVRDDCRRNGIGRTLVERVADDAAQKGAQLVVVETLGPSVAEPEMIDGYGGTRAFYARIGFLPVKEVQLRNWNSDSAILLARVLTGSRRDRLR